MLFLGSILPEVGFYELQVWESWVCDAFIILKEIGVQQSADFFIVQTQFSFSLGFSQYADVSESTK